MLLVVDTIIHGVLCRNLMRHVEDDEAAFNALNKLINQGFELRRALLQDDKHQLSIPIEAFDGQPIGGQLNALQGQWQALLKREPAR